MRFQTTLYELPPTGNGSMQYYHEFLEKDTRDFLPRRGDFLGLYFSLSEEMEYVVRNLQSGTIKGLHYCMLYAPRKSCELIKPRGYYASFCVQVNAYFLKGLAASFPMLYPFMAKADQSIPVSLTKEPLLATAPMIQIIYEVIMERYKLSGELRGMYMAAKLIDILMVCLLHIQTQYTEGPYSKNAASAQKAKGTPGQDPFFYQ